MTAVGRFLAACEAYDEAALKGRPYPAIPNPLPEPQFPFTVYRPSRAHEFWTVVYSRCPASRCEMIVA